MATLTLRIPKSPHVNIKVLARSEGISVNQFIASAAGEKMASLLTVEFLRREAAKDNRADFERFLGAVPDREPELGDELNAKTAREKRGLSPNITRLWRGVRCRRMLGRI